MQAGIVTFVRLVDIHESDKRDYPRLHAGLPLRYRTVSSSEATAWTSGDPIGGDWIEPDPYMNFSVDGLRFDCTDGLEKGSLVALELHAVRGRPKNPFRVRRCSRSADRRPKSSCRDRVRSSPRRSGHPMSMQWLRMKKPFGTGGEVQRAGGDSHVCPTRGYPRVGQT